MFQRLTDWFMWSSFLYFSNLHLMCHCGQSKQWLPVQKFHFYSSYCFYRLPITAHWEISIKMFLCNSQNKIEYIYITHLQFAYEFKVFHNSDNVMNPMNCYEILWYANCKCVIQIYSILMWGLQWCLNRYSWSKYYRCSSINNASFDTFKVKIVWLCISQITINVWISLRTVILIN